MSSEKRENVIIWNASLSWEKVKRRVGGEKETEQMQVSELVDNNPTISIITLSINILKTQNKINYLSG